MFAFTISDTKHLIQFVISVQSGKGRRTKKHKEDSDEQSYQLHTEDMRSLPTSLLKQAASRNHRQLRELLSILNRPSCLR